MKVNDKVLLRADGREAIILAIDDEHHFVRVAFQGAYDYKIWMPIDEIELLIK